MGGVPQNSQEASVAEAEQAEGSKELSQCRKALTLGWTQGLMGTVRTLAFTQSESGSYQKALPKERHTLTYGKLILLIVVWRVTVGSQCEAGQEVLRQFQQYRERCWRFTGR